MCRMVIMTVCVDKQWPPRHPSMVRSRIGEYQTRMGVSRNCQQQSDLGRDNGYQWNLPGSLLARTTSTLHGLPTSSQLRPADGGVAHRKLAGVDDVYTALAAIQQPSPAFCGWWSTGMWLFWTTATLRWLVSGSLHRPAAGESTMRWPPSGSRQRQAAGALAHRKLAGVDDLYTARAAFQQPAQAGCGGWRTGMWLF